MQKPCNYYDKYIKYKKKYIDYKNKLLDIKGGGINSSIRFYTVGDGGSEQSVSSTELPSFLNGNNISRLHIKILYIHEDKLKFIAYRFIKKVGSGSYGDVYQIEQVEPVPQPGSPNFVIKLNIKKRDKKYNMVEGETIDGLKVSPSVKAIFQGWVGNIDYAIYNYLGQNLHTFFSKWENLKDFTQEQYRSLIEQLHTQLYALNSNRQYHNDVKIDNIVMCKTTSSDDYELSLIDYKLSLIDYKLSLIDYGLLTRDNSDKGSFHSMCIRGCAQYLSIDIPFFNQANSLFISTSTDYVGFFHVVVFLLNPTYKHSEIYTEILGLTPTKKGVWYTSENICKVLCLLCYVSGCSNERDVATVDAFLGNYTSTVTGIDKVLKDKCTGEHFQKFTSVIPGYVEGKNLYRDRRILFLCFIYSKITVGYGVDYHTFIPIDELPLFLWRLSYCFDFRFDLEQFDTNLGTIFRIPPIAVMSIQTFFSKPENLIGFTKEHTLSLIEQLHTQLHTLNNQNHFYNNVNIDNIGVRKLYGSNKYELSLIDSRLSTYNSDRGTFVSMCIRGCAQYLFDMYKQQRVNTNSISALLGSTSTDYVGFFHIFVFLLNPTYKPFDIYKEILGLTPLDENWYTSENICKVLCLLCYVSGCSDETDVATVDAFLGNYTSTVTKIDKVLKGKCTEENLRILTSVIPGYVEGENKYTDRRVLFLCFIYSKITVDYGVGYPTFILIDELPLFLWRFSCCFDFRFDLDKFNKST
jgi:hypothetical protein